MILRKDQHLRIIDPSLDLPLGAHILNLDRRLTNNLGNLFRVLNLLVFVLVLGHLLVHRRRGFLKNVVEELDCTLSGRHAEDHT